MDIWYDYVPTFFRCLTYTILLIFVLIHIIIFFIARFNEHIDVRLSFNPKKLTIVKNGANKYFIKYKVYGFWKFYDRCVDPHSDTQQYDDLKEAKEILKQLQEEIEKGKTIHKYTKITDLENELEG